MIPTLTSLNDVADRYSAFFIDLWGVLHNGVLPHPGAIDSLKNLRLMGKKIALISNAPRRSANAVQSLTTMGFVPSLYDFLMTSGEATHQALLYRPKSWLQQLGTRCFVIGGERNASTYQGLPLQFVTSPDQAEFVLLTGTNSYDDTLGQYEEVLHACYNAHLPMVCANPDLEVLQGDRMVICAGMQAARYAEIGGKVYYFGKPYPEVYEAALEKLKVDRKSVLMIGDNLRTDIEGAGRFDIHSLLITGGVHAHNLDDSIDLHPSEAKLYKLINAAPFKPTYLMSRFTA